MPCNRKCYRAFLLENLIISEKAGKGVYTERNYEIIDNSDICVVYFKEENNYKSCREHNKLKSEKETGSIDIQNE